MSTNSFLRGTIITFLFLVLLVPFVVSDSLFFPFITGKAFLFRFLVEMSGFLYLVLALRVPEYRPRKSYLGYAVLGFIVIVALADLFGANSYRSFWSNFERMEGLVSLLHLAIFGVVASGVFSEKNWTWFWNSSLVVSVCMGIFAFAQYGGRLKINQGGVRVDGTLGNATYLAVYMLFNIFIAAYFFLKRKEAWRWVYGVLFVIYSIVLVLTGTRGALIGLLAGFLAAVVGMTFFSGEAHIRRGSMIVLAVVLLLGGGFFMARKSEVIQKNPILSRFANISFKDETTNSRLVIWGMAIEGWKEHPLLGWGQENFNLVFNKYYNEKLYAQEQWFDRAHSVLFDWLVAGGLLGLLAYLSLFAAALYLLFKSSRFSATEKSVLVGLIVAYFVQNLAVFDNLVSGIYFFALLAYIQHVYTREHVSSGAVWMPSQTLRDGCVSFGLVLLVVTLYFVEVKPILASRSLIAALSSQPEGAAKNIEYFKQAIAYNTFGTSEAREQLAQAAYQGRATNGANQALVQELSTLAQTEMALQFAASPDDARYALFLGGLHLASGDIPHGIEVLQKAQALSPKKQTIMFELGQAYLRAGQYDKALEVFKKAYDLAPEFSHAGYWYGAALIYNGREAEARTLLKERFGTESPVEIRFAGAYEAIKDYRALEGLWRSFVEQEPSNVRYRVVFARALLFTGKREEAVSELVKISTLDSSLKGEVDSLVKAVREGKNPLQ